MAKHQRQIIREAVCERLRSKTDAADRVFPTREVPWKRTELPGIAVYTLDEASSVELGDDPPRVLDRSLQLAVLAVVSLTEDVDDALDDMARQIEAVMNADARIGVEAVVDSVLTSTAIDVTAEDGRPVGAIRLAYEVQYQTSAADPA